MGLRSNRRIAVFLEHCFYDSALAQPGRVLVQIESSEVTYPSIVMKPPADVEYLEEAHLLIWRPRGILDEAAVNKVLVDLIRRETMATKPFNRFSDLSAIESFHLTFKYVFHVALYRRLSYAGREPIKSAFYVTHPEAAHLVRIHALMTDHSPLEVEMFE
jgi:hypothetical protein